MTAPPGLEIATLSAWLVALASVTAPAELVTVSFVAVIAVPTACVIGPVPVDVIATGPALTLPRIRSASESRTLMLPRVAPLELLAENVPILLPALRSVMSLPPVLVTVRLSAITGSVCAASAPTVIVTTFPVMPASVRSSSSLSVMDEPAVVAVAATVEVAKWMSMLPVPAVSVTAAALMSEVASAGVTSRIERPAESVMVLAVADNRLTRMSAVGLVVVRMIVPVVVTLVAVIVPCDVTLTLALLLPTTALSSTPVTPTSLMTIFWFFC